MQKCNNFGVLELTICLIIKPLIKCLNIPIEFGTCANRCKCQVFVFVNTETDSSQKKLYLDSIQIEFLPFNYMRDFPSNHVFRFHN